VTITFEVTVTSSSADDLLTHCAPAGDNLLTGGCYALGQRLAEQSAGASQWEQE
jgi:hypothetical protein